MSCLFIAFEKFVNINHEIIRKTICDSLANNDPIMKDIDTNIILTTEDPDYIKKMRSINTMGSAIEIQAFCNIYNASVRCYITLDRSTYVDFITLYPNEFTKNFKLIWAHHHYEATI